MSLQEEASGKTQDGLEGLSPSAGPEVPWIPPSRAGRSFGANKKKSVHLCCLFDQAMVKQKQMDGSLSVIGCEI